jgi:uncharacterized alkaline shock family protein YloU
MTEPMESKRDDEAQTKTKSSKDTKASGQAPARRSSTAPATAHASLTSETGTTHIADTVVAKIAGIATREIPGVHSMGSGFARRMGQLRAMVPGQADSGGSTQGVAVEVGEKEAAIDLDVVTYYGESITEVSDAVRRNIIDRVEGMTGLQVVEVNINVDDIFVEGEETTEEEPRVQ